MSFTFSKFRFYFNLLLLACCTLASTKSFATHYAAIDMYIDYVGSGPSDLRYKVTLSVYKACEPGSSDLTTGDGTISINSSCGSLGQVLLPLEKIDTLDQLCQNFSLQNSCRSINSIYPGFVRWRFVDTLTLPTVCTDWNFSWSSCCRNGGIVNITPNQGDLYIEAIMNTAADYSNSTPRFLIDPLPYLCVNQPGFYVNGPFDPNTDSLVTDNVCPLQTAGNCFNYNAGYTLANPLNSTTGYAVNTTTGTSSFTPSLTGKFVLAFQCKEYDPYTQLELSSIRRDVQVSVLSCNAPPPYIDSLPQNLSNATYDPGTQSIIACPGVPLSFDVNGLSMSGTNNVFMTSNNLSTIPGSIFTVTNNGSGSPVGNLSWTPTGADIGNHTLIIFVKDSTCSAVQPILLTNYFVVQIKVLPGVDAGPDGKICGINGTPWQFDITGPPSVNYYWTGYPSGPTLGLSNDSIPNPTAYPPYNFTYIVTTDDINNNCKNKDTVTIYIDTSNSVQTLPDNILICRPGYVQLDAQGVGLKPLANLTCGTVPQPVSCPYPDSAEVRTQYSGGGQLPSPVYTPFSGDHRTARMQYLLTKDDLYDYGLRSGTITSLAFFVTTPTPTTYDNFSISIKCADREDLSLASGGFEPGTIPVYTATGPVTPTLGWNVYTFNNAYNWDSTKALVVEVCYSNAINGTATSVNAVQTLPITMITSYSNVGSGNICQNPTIANTVATFYFRPTIKLNYCPASEAEFAYTWAPGTFLSDSTIKNPTAYVSESISYEVFTRGRNGCLVKDQVNIVVPVHNYDVFPLDTSICAGQSYQMEANAEGSNVEWFFADPTPVLPTYIPATTDILSCLNCTNPIATPEKTGRYVAVFTDANQCKDTVAVDVEVRPLPEVYILNHDTTIKYGQSIELQVAGAYIYNWAPVSTLSNPNIVNPLATPSEPLTYTVIGLADNGCRNVDSVRINIDYRDNLFVPSAFTPNGDGKNDIFKVTNITFQKLQEFRVFNRWGQEIFRTNDAATGWDGTWRGVAQDMGAYQYLIRVAYPDGYIETYKGDVTLIR